MVGRSHSLTNEVAGSWGKVHGKKTATGDPGDNFPNRLCGYWPSQLGVNADVPNFSSRNSEPSPDTQTCPFGEKKKRAVFERISILKKLPRVSMTPKDPLILGNDPIF